MEEPDCTSGLGCPVQDERPFLPLLGSNCIFIFTGGNKKKCSFPKETREIGNYSPLLLLLTGIAK